MHDIETLITHFLSVSWGPVIPAGEACVTVEATKGLNALLPRERPRHDLVSHPDPLAVVSPHASRSLDQSRGDRARPPRDPRQRRLRARRHRSLMPPDPLAPCSAKRNNTKSKPKQRRILYAARACIDALNIVQRHRGWISDESLRDIASAVGHDAARARCRRDILQPDLSPAGGADGHSRVRQHQLLGDGLRPRLRRTFAKRSALAGERRPPTASSPSCRSRASAPATARLPRWSTANFTPTSRPRGSTRCSTPVEPPKPPRAHRSLPKRHGKTAHRAHPT